MVEPDERSSSPVIPLVLQPSASPRQRGGYTLCLAGRPAAVQVLCVLRRESTRNKARRIRRRAVLACLVAKPRIAGPHKPGGGDGAVQWTPYYLVYVNSILTGCKYIHSSAVTTPAHLTQDCTFCGVHTYLAYLPKVPKVV